MATRKKAVPEAAVREDRGEEAGGEEGRREEAGREEGRSAKRPAAKKPAPGGRVAKAAGEALRLAGVGTDAVARATGKAWDQWLAILDKAGAAAMPHKAIAAMLADRYGVPPWWSQMVDGGLRAGARAARGAPEERRVRGQRLADAAGLARSRVRGLDGPEAARAVARRRPHRGHARHRRQVDAHHVDRGRLPRRRELLSRRARARAGCRWSTASSPTRRPARSRRPSGAAPSTG